MGTLEVAMVVGAVVSRTGLDRCDGKGKTTKVLACSANVDAEEQATQGQERCEDKEQAKIWVYDIGELVSVMRARLYARAHLSEQRFLCCWCVACSDLCAL